MSNKKTVVAINDPRGNDIEIEQIPETTVDGGEAGLYEPVTNGAISANEFAMTLMEMVNTACAQTGGTLYLKSLVNTTTTPGQPMVIMIAVGAEALQLASLIPQSQTNADPEGPSGSLVTPGTPSVN